MAEGADLTPRPWPLQCPGVECPLCALRECCPPLGTKLQSQLCRKPPLITRARPKVRAVRWAQSCSCADLGANPISGEESSNFGHTVSFTSPRGPQFPHLSNRGSQLFLSHQVELSLHRKPADRAQCSVDALGSPLALSTGHIILIYIPLVSELEGRAQSLSSLYPQFPHRAQA